MEGLFLEAVVENAVEPRHFFNIRLRQEYGVIGNEEDALLNGQIFKHRLAVYQELAAVRTVNAGDDAQKSRFPCAVRADHAIDRPLFNAAVQLIQSGKRAEPLG